MLDETPMATLGMTATLPAPHLAASRATAARSSPGRGATTRRASSRIASGSCQVAKDSRVSDPAMNDSGRSG